MILFWVKTIRFEVKKILLGTNDFIWGTKEIILFLIYTCKKKVRIGQPRVGSNNSKPSGIPIGSVSSVPC